MRFRLALALTALLPAVAQAPFATSRLWDLWPQVRISPSNPWSLKHADLRAALTTLEARAPGTFQVVEEAPSSEGRTIPLLRVGHGPTPVLLWSQMHGDEPSGTAALLDLLAWMADRPGDPGVRRLRSRLTLWILPMLNPDGAQRTQRRSAQEVDINRDALALATPEARYLKAVRDRVQPTFGYNLHNQNPLLRVGPTGPQAALSLLAVPGDARLTETPGVVRAQRLAVAVLRATAPVAPGRVARYDTDYTPRAFGDSMTRWGTPTLLIETGGWAGPDENARLVRLTFLAITSSLGALSERNLPPAPGAAYHAIPLNRRDLTASFVLRGVTLLQPREVPTFSTDLAFNVPGPFAGDAPRSREPALQDLGDLSHLLGLLNLQGQGLLAVPWVHPPGGAASPDPPEAWPALRDRLTAQGLAVVEPTALRAAHAQLGEAALARPGFKGPVLLYRPEGSRLHLAGAILRGHPVGADLPQPSLAP